MQFNKKKHGQIQLNLCKLGRGACVKKQGSEHEIIIIIILYVCMLRRNNIFV